MNKRILRTAAGATVAPYVIETLQKAGHWVFAVDIDKRAVGFHFANKAEIVPRVNAHNYLNILLRICEEEKIDIFWPDLDEELGLIARHKHLFESVGTLVLLSDEKTIETCADKYLTAKALQNLGLPVPFTTTERKEIPAFPFIIKPRAGRGSQGVYLVENTEQLAAITQLNPSEDVVYQNYLSGDEFTVDVLSDFKGQFLYAVPRTRLATDSGISTKGKVFENDVLVAYIKKACNALGIKGPSCFQGRINPTSGEPFFFEINPRIAGTVNLSEAAGAPIITDSIKALCEEPIEMPKIAYNTVLLRYWASKIVQE